MALKPKANITNIEDFLYGLGPVKNDVISFRKVDFEVFKGKRGIELSLEHPGSSKDLNAFKSGIFKELIGNFTGLTRTTDRQGFKILKMPGGVTIDFDVEENEDVGKTKGVVIPTRIQEEGSTIVFNRALRDNKKFTADKDENILVNGKDIKQDKVYKELVKVFTPKWVPRLNGWLWTYYQQQKEMLVEYSGRQWDEFTYDNDSFVKFFERRMKKLTRGGGVAAGRYETWNPADVYAVKGMTNVKRDIDKAIKNPDPNNLTELNSVLINLMEREELVGISLKKVNQGANAEIHLHNVESSGALKALTSFSKMERYSMNDIHFRVDSIFTLSSVTTAVKIGPNNEYSINITRGGNNLTFGTAIKRTPAAQGGLAPIDMVVKMLKTKEFKKNHTDYPKDAIEFVKEESKYKKMYAVVSKEYNQAPKFDEWEKSMTLKYAKNVRDAKATLMQLSFWYDAISGHGKDAEFWTDLLYTGMKITTKGQFAPHAKIS